MSENPKNEYNTRPFVTDHDQIVSQIIAIRDSITDVSDAGELRSIAGQLSELLGEITEFAKHLELHAAKAPPTPPVIE